MEMTMTQMKGQQTMLRKMDEHFCICAAAETMPEGSGVRARLEQRAADTLRELSVLQCIALEKLPADGCILGIKEKCDPPHQLKACVVCYRDKFGLPEGGER